MGGNQKGDIVLKKCNKDEECVNQVYGKINSANDSPQVLSTEPAEFVNDVNVKIDEDFVTTCTPDGGVPAAETRGGLVDSFCIR